MSSSIHHPNSNASFPILAAHRRIAVFASICLLVLFGVAEAGACLTEAAAVPLTAGESWTDPGTNSVCFVVTVSGPGLLAVEVVQRADAPRVYLSPAGIDSEGSTKIVRRTGQVLLLDAAPGRYGFSVSAVGGDQAPFRFHTRLAQRAFGKDEHDSEIELEPEVFSGPFNKDEHDSEIELEPEVFAGRSKVPADLASVWQQRPGLQAQLCRADASAAAGGSLLCASTLPGNAETRGEIGTTWGDDAHVYRFDVASVGPVAIEALAAEGRSDELTVELFDRFGQRLGSWLGASPSGNTQSGNPIRILVPGTYFVRLQSEYGARLGYDLVIDDLASGAATKR